MAASNACRCASSRITRTRSAGCRGSMGTYAPPALRMASNERSSPTPRGTATPTREPDTIPIARNRRAIWFDRASSSA